MNKHSLLPAFAASLLTSGVFAASMNNNVEQPNGAWVGTLSAGAAWERGGATQTLFLAPTIEKTYDADRSTHTLFHGEVFVGWQRTLSPTVQGQMGLAIAANSTASLSGAIWDDANPQFNNFIYSYKIQHTDIALKGKFLANQDFWVMPWISGSVGVGFNDARSFSNTPILFQALPNPNFESHTETAFTYTVGAGIQKALSDHWQVGMGYEFADWGRSHLGPVSEQTTSQGLSLNHLYTNSLQFNLTWVS